MPDNNGYYGTQRPNDRADEYNATLFVVRQLLNTRHHVAWVKVVNVSTAGGVAMAGTVDVQPLVNQLDGGMQPVAHGVVNGLPYLRMQGGANAVIMDPQAGDIGLCLFADRDSSSVQATRGVANPGSLRQCDMADGVYLGGILNGVPTQYAIFDANGIKIVSPTKIEVNAPEIDLVAPVIDMQASTSVTITTPTFTVNGNTQFNGNAHSSGTVTGDVDVVAAGISGKSHHHGLVKSGTDLSGGPQ